MKKLLLAVLLTFGLATLAIAAATRFTDLEAQRIEATKGYKLPVVDVAVSTPTETGLLVRTSGYVLYISTNATGVNGWQKVGGQ